jgi:heme O synthase-like polyprenyltransferase
LTDKTRIGLYVVAFAIAAYFFYSAFQVKTYGLIAAVVVCVLGYFSIRSFLRNPNRSTKEDSDDN